MKARWLANVAMATIVRRLTYLALAAVLAYFSVGKAHAQSDSPTCNAATSLCDQGEAYTTAITEANDSVCVGTGYVNNRKGDATVYSADRYLGRRSCFRASDSTTAMQANATAFFPRSCLSRNAIVNIKNVPVTRAWNKHCVGGCTFSVLEGGKRIDNQTISSGARGTLWSGVFEYTGEICFGEKFGISLTPAITPAPNQEADPLREPVEECVQAGTQTMCIKPDGQRCHTASTGRQVCWAANEVGEKTDLTAIQKRENGTPSTPTPPTTPPPPGDTWRRGETTQGTERLNGSGSGTTHTTTTWTTTSGGPAGQTNQGQPGGKPNGQPGGTGTEGPANGSAGGETCGSAPTFTGDALLGNILRQSWETRCNIENGDVQGTDDCGADGTGGAPNTCTGDKILCHMVEQARQVKCAALAAASKLQGDANSAGPIDQPFDPWAGGEGEGTTLNGGLLNMAAGTGELFPSFELEGVQMSMPQAIYDLIDVIKAIVIAAFALLAMFIAGGSGRP